MWRDIVFFVCLSIRFCSADVCTVTRFEDVNQATSSCQSITIKDIKIPQTTTLEINLNNGADLVFDGRITHVPAEWTGDLVVIRGSNVTISGTSNHLFDGLGPQHWKGANEPIILRPKFLRFKVHDSTIQHLNLLNCPRQCIHISSSSNVHVSDIYIDNKAGYKGVAPNNKFGHNTDGIDVSGSDSIYIKDVTVFNQDDCVAISSGSHLYFENFFCNGSHGLSLSVSGGEASNIVFKDSVVTYAKWAIHIKTHNEGTEGHIYNVLYQNITFTGFCSADVCTVIRFEDVNQATSSCQSITIKDIEIPQTTTLEINLNNGAELVFDGRITHVPVEWTGDLVVIRGSNVTISGTSNHVFDGLGAQHWKGDKESSILRPMFLRFILTDATINDIHVLNCPNHCIHITDSSNVQLTNVLIDNRDGYQGVAPAHKFAKNTDGIDVATSSNILVKDVTCYNQDDCVAINSGTDLHFENLYCNGSHGLSISVGVGEVGNVVFKDSIVENGANGIHVKTHNDGTEGTIHNVTYQNLIFKGILNYGISVQQNYPKGEVKGNVPITKLNMIDITGTVSEKAHTYQILCAEGACSDWNWTKVKLTGSKVKDDCLNVPTGIDC